MKKEPLSLYIVRIALSIGLFALVAMLYWSSTLIESDLKALQSDINLIKGEVTATRADTLKLRNAISERPLNIPTENHSAASASAPAQSSVKAGRHIDPTLPNLLKEDPFYQTTLPKLLGPHFTHSGTYHIAALGKPENFHPFSNWSQVSAWNSQCTVSVARQQFGIYETLAPDMAIKMEERKDKETGRIELWVHLRDGVFWQPLRQDFFPEGITLSPHFLSKHPVTAHDFKFYFDALMNPSVQEPGAVSLRTYLGDIEELKVIDDLTFTVRWRAEKVEQPNGEVAYKTKYVARQLTGSLRPLASFIYQYFPDGTKIIEEDTDPNTYRQNSVWAQNFAQHWAKNIIASCGAWIYDGMSDREIRFTRNKDHYFPNDVLVEAEVVQFKDTPDAIWQDFKANHLDSYDIRPDQQLELEAFLQSAPYKSQEQEKASIHKLEYLGRSYSYIGWNEARPFFRSKKVRQAMTMAIDRQRIIRQSLNNMGIEITCPFYRYSPAYDASILPWPYDVQRAKRLLEEEGWYDSNGDGIIDKEIDGKSTPFQFRLTYYVRNPTTKSICEYVATALKEVGISCTLNGVDIADLSAVFEDKNFDALCLAWSLGTPPDDPKQLWYSSGAKERGSSNAVGFSNAEADSIIDALQYENDPVKRNALYHRFDAIIHDESPYTFLYSPKTVMLYRDYLQNVFIPVDRQDLVPGANVAQPDTSVTWLRKIDSTLNGNTDEHR